MFFLLWGFLIWLGASAIFRFAGHFFFLPENQLMMLASYILVIPLILVLTLPIYRYKRIEGHERLKVAVLIALPGMLIDAIVLIYFLDLFVNLDPETDRYFGSWLLWTYSLIIFTGLFQERNTYKNILVILKQGKNK
ncbi:DUF5367 domain-containing protein [Pseudalkalibacillus decolorationis]|uniref:DUF5367 domain-containing protein n=1 Tax=Pseudalkalibacillus decolorationis TaxID=163879 RepID=UPI002148018A|nr:DUF5367 domain-containing protein [Pseudalkalibacillus decolorationis]